MWIWSLRKVVFMQTTSGKQSSNNYKHTTQWRTEKNILECFTEISKIWVFISEHKNEQIEKITVLQLSSIHLENIGEGADMQRRVCNPATLTNMSK